MSLWLSADEMIELTGYRQREPQKRATLVRSPLPEVRASRWALTAIEAAQHCKSRPDYVSTGPLLRRVRAGFATASACLFLLGCTREPPRPPDCDPDPVTPGIEGTALDCRTHGSAGSRD